MTSTLLLALLVQYIPLDQVKPGPNIKPLECGIERVVPMDTLIAIHQGQNGLEFYDFDTDRDGVKDAQFAIPQGDENRYPLFYAFDRQPYDDEPNIIYHDTLRDGTCNGINVYWTPVFDPKGEV